MKFSKRIMAWVITFMMLFSLTGAFPAETWAESDNSVTVYFTLSEDGQFVTGNDPDATLMARVPVEVEYFDLADYGLEDYYRYEAADAEDGGEYIGTEVVKQPTLLHLYIKMIEQYYLGSGEKLEVGGKALTLTGSSTSMYMKQFWGHDENLMYYVNHRYPLMREGWGATADYILLEEGMEIDVAMFTDWAFYHNGAFAQLTPSVTTVKAGEEFTLKMTGTGTFAEAPTNPMAGEELVYANADDTYGGNSNRDWNLVENAETDENGDVTLSFSKPGTYYISSTVEYQSYVSDSGMPCVAPPIAVITVEGDEAEMPEDTDGTENITVLSGLKFAAGTAAVAQVFSMTPGFDAESGEYTVYVPDSAKTIAVTAEESSEAAGVQSKTVIKAEYMGTDGSACSYEKAAGSAMNLPRLITAGSGDTELKITAECGLSSQEYNVNVKRVPSLASLSITDSDGNAVAMDTVFDSGKTEYTAIVPGGTEFVTLSTGAAYDGYTVKTSAGTGDTHKISLKGNDAEKVTVEVAGANGITNTYTITVSKRQWLTAEFVNLAEGTVVQVLDENNHDVLKTEISGTDCVTVENVMDGKKYTYRITNRGYKGKTGTIELNGKSVTVDGTLEAVNANTSINNQIQSAWPDFRGSKDNNAVTDVKTPVLASETNLMWAVQSDGGWTGAPSSPILVDGDVVFTSNNEILKLDSVTGEVKQRGQMVTKSVFNITPPTYADGMIFVALAGGRIQAFDAATLESLWVYRDELSGQPNSPVTYHNGYIYTGFWNNDDKDANYVCLRAEDEDKDSAEEVKVATWTYNHKGGFYWAGAHASDTAIVVGSENGSEDSDAQTGVLYSFDPATGNVLDKIEGINGDIRSTIVYDGTTGKYCFSGESGTFYTVKMNGDGTFNKDTLTALELQATGTTAGSAGDSSSTPVVYNGRAYVGVSGKSSLGSYSGHNITVIDLEKNQIAYAVETRGYPQTSGLLTTAYESEDGYNYIYFIENVTPGIIRVLKDKPGQTEPILNTEENGGILGEAKHNTYADTLFTPRGEQAEYCVASPVVDEYGTIYFKNDSSHIMALGSKITELVITKMPDKTNYQLGEIFDPAGMVVTARYANGMERDVTQYVKYSVQPLTSGDLEIEVSFEHVMYNDKAKKIDPPTAYVAIECIDDSQKSDSEVVMDLINLIPETAETEEEWKAKEAAVDTARTAFDALGYDVQKYIINKDVLVEAETAIAERKLLQGETEPAVRVESAAYNSLKVSWTANSNAGGYEIYRSTDPAQLGTKVKTVTDPAVLELVNGVTTGTVYYYTVRPYITVDGSPAGSLYREPVSGKSALNKVKGVKATATGYGTVQLKWNKVDGANGYEIWRSTSKNKGYKKIKTVNRGTTLTFKNTGLKTGTKYFYKIKAYRGTAVSEFSVIVNATPKLAAVKGFKALKGKNKATLKWKKVSGASGYVIYRSTKAKSGFKAVKTIKKGKTVKYVNTGLKKGKTYYFKVRAYRTVSGKKVYSSYTSVKKVKVK